jgi:hypothetical protein
MNENQAKPDGGAGDESALPFRRQDIQEGLRSVHEMLTATQDEGIKAAAYVRALAFILVNKGIIRPEELEAMMRQVRWQLAQQPTPRVRLGSTRDKYTAAGAVDIDCASRMPLCQARCCTFAFFLTKQDLDEGLVRWDYGNHYWIKQASDGYCTHCDPGTRFCTIHAQRPFVCRKFDCRREERIWIDFEARIPAPPADAPGDDPVAMAELLLHQDASRARQNWMDPENP